MEHLTSEEQYKMELLTLKVKYEILFGAIEDIAYIGFNGPIEDPARALKYAMDLAYEAMKKVTIDEPPTF